MSLVHGIIPGASLPHASRRWNPDHKHEISVGKGWIPRDHVEPKQHARAIRALQPQYTTG